MDLRYVADERVGGAPKLELDGQNWNCRLVSDSSFWKKFMQ